MTEEIDPLDDLMVTGRDADRLALRDWLSRMPERVREELRLEISSRFANILDSVFEKNRDRYSRPDTIADFIDLVKSEERGDE